MKKLIMFVMVIAISATALAELGEDADLNPPDWAGARGTIYGTFDFAEALWIIEGAEREAPSQNRLMVPHETLPDPEESDWFEGEDGVYLWNEWVGEGTTVWNAEYEGREGVLSNIEEGFSFDGFNFPGAGTKIIRIQLTMFGATPEGIEVEGEGGGAGFYFEEFEPPKMLSEIPLGDDWFHRTYEYVIPGNPEWEAVTFWNETEVMAIDQMVIDTICYDGESPPVGPGRKGGAVKTEISIDPNITTIYEPQDPEEFGPPLDPVTQPVVGNFGVKLGWRPGELMHTPEPNYIPEFTVTVTLDPNTEGLTRHEDYFIWGENPSDGTIQLVFDQNNFDVLQEVHIQAIKDLDREGNESYILGLTSVCAEDPNFQNAELTMRVNVVDNDVRHVSALPTRITLSETDAGDPCGTKEIAVRLSHQPSDNANVYVLVYGEEFAFEEEMFIIDPNFETWTDPNRMTFTATTWGGGSCSEYNETTMTSCWDKPLTIQVHAQDNDEVAEPDVTNIFGLVVFAPYSEDLEYCVDSLKVDPRHPELGFPIEVVNGNGKAEETEVDVIVEDDDCGAKGYDIADVTEDCIVNLADFAEFFSQWLLCTQPYDDDEVCDKLWEQ